MITDKFYVTSGSIIGSAHRTRYKNNQDALYMRQKSDTLCAVVCDGCSQSKRSEIGAGLVSRYIVNQCLNLFSPKLNDITLSECENNLRALKERTLLFIADTIEDIGYELNIGIQEMFLFTVLCIVMNNSYTLIFNAGDGSYVINDVFHRIEQENKPQYITYGLIKGVESPSFQIQALMKTQEVNNLMLCSDGVDYLLQNPKRRLKDGKQCGGYKQFLEDGRYNYNLSLLQKRLVVLGGINGVLKDDTSIILIRRKDGSYLTSYRQKTGVEEDMKR